MEKVKLGIIGCGNISGAYFKGAQAFEIVEIKSCADLNMDVAQAQAEEYGVQAVTVDELLADSEIEIVINLTIPAVHAKVSLQVLNAGKHVHSEKPFGINLEEAAEVLAVAKEKGLRVGSAPDTFLGAGLQTCRKILDDNWIGDCVAGTAFMLSNGPESWHPNPAFFYKTGGGPMLDMGPYYMSALVHLLGPAKSVTGIAVKSFDERVAGCKEHFNERLPVEVPTHYSGIIEFVNGALITVIISFDVFKHSLPRIELYGKEGSLAIPDPNTFGGDVKVFRPGNEDWEKVPYSHLYSENSRIIGAVDMAHAIQTDRPHRCNGEFAYHVLEIMMAFEKSNDCGGKYQLESTCEQPAPLPLGLLQGLLD
ncbi:MAG: oxidoreductase [Planctomycetota bacterium]|nr:MAG: oxidoreductase [Planctomycetota bacterium]